MRRHLYTRVGRRVSRPGATVRRGPIKARRAWSSWARVRRAPKYTVLIVDDERILRDLLSDLLRDAGYEVAHAENGRAALAVLETRRVNVILLDLMMPVMDGFTFRARQLDHPRLAHIPVIFLSASFDAATTLDLVASASYVSKPFDTAVVLRAVDDACKRAA